MELRRRWRVGWPLLLLLLGDIKGWPEAGGGVAAILLLLGSASGGRQAPGGVPALQPCRNLRCPSIRWFVRLKNNDLYRITYIFRVWNLVKFGGKIRQINHANSSGKFKLKKIRQMGFSQFVAVCSLQLGCLFYVCHVIFFGFLFLQTRVLSWASLSFSKSEDKICTLFPWHYCLTMDLPRPG